MAQVCVRVRGPEIRLAVTEWVKLHLSTAKNVEISTSMTLAGILREILDDDQTYIDVFFTSEKSPSA